jgi:hypothetical protein
MHPAYSMASKIPKRESCGVASPAAPLQQFSSGELWGSDGVTSQANLEDILPASK